jgi:ubiquitin C-terminal hydrolase
MISKGEGQLRNCTARTQQTMLTRYKANQENDEMPNAGLSNTGIICYSNAIFQALVSCNHLTTFFDTPPQQIVNALYSITRLVKCYIQW